MNRLRTPLLLVMVLATPTWTANGIRGAEPPATEVLAEFPIRKDAPLLTIPVMFQGRTYRFVLDTGSSLVVYDKVFEGQLGPPRKSVLVSTASDPVTVNHYNAPEAMLGPLSLRTEESVVCCDLSAFSKAGVGRIDGLVGMSFLRQYALTLDFAHRKIQFRREAGIAADRAIPLRCDEATWFPLIEVALPGEAPRS